MKTLLDRPLFNLKPDVSARLYANCSNSLEVVRGSRVTFAHIQVGASLFHLMRWLKVPASAEVSLYLDQEGDLAVFGMCINEGEIIDLWTYPNDTLPPFLARDTTT